MATTEAAEDVSRLVFRAGSTPVCDGAAPPYEFVWTDAVPGTHTLSSQLILQSGEIITNTTRRIRVTIPNTNVLTALPIEGRQGNLTIDLRGSEKDPDATTASAWFRWVAPADGYLLVQTTNRSLSSAKVQFSVGTQQLTILRTNGSLSLNGWTAAQVTNGVTYNLRIAGMVGALMPPLLYELLERPENDAFQAPLNLSGSGLTTRSITLPASAEPGEPAHGNRPAARSLVYRWTSPAAGQVAVHTSPAARVAVFRGDTLETLTLLTYGVWDIAFQAVAGEPYQIMFDTNGGAGPAVTAVDLILDQPPVNDAFAHRTTLEGASTVVTGWNIGARRELFEPAHAGRSGGRSAWYRWQAPASGRATVTIDGDIATTLLAVYTGDSVQTLHPVASHAGTQQGMVAFDAIAGQDYAFAVDGGLGAAGDFTLSLQFEGTAPPPVFSVVGLVAGNLRVMVGGLAGRAARVEISSDLVHWNDWSTIPPGLEHTEITDPAAEAARFYRVRLTP